MKIPVKVLYASYLPSVKDRDKILMADSGANVGGKPPVRNLLSSIPDSYLDNLDKIGQGNGSPYPNRTPQPTNPFDQFNSRDPQSYNGPINPYNPSDVNQIQPDTGNYHPQGQVQGFPGGISDENYVNPVIQPHHDTPQPYNGQVGKAIVTGAAAFDSLLPYGRINRWPRVTPGLSPNQHPYGTGSQALMEYGGKMPNGGTTKKPNPYGNRFVAFPYGQSGSMPTTNTIDLNSKQRVNAVNDRGYVNMYNSVDQFGNKNTLNDEQVPYRYLSGANRNNFAVGNDSVYVAPGVDRTNVHLPMAYGGKLEDSAASGIHIKPSHRGKFTAFKKRTGETTQEALHSKSASVRKMAVFANNASKWKHEDGGIVEAKDGHWIQNAINPSHKGYCTPMTKATCTPHRKAFAMRAKHHNLADGGPVGDGPISYPADHLGSSFVKGKWVNNNFKSGGSIKPAKAAEILHDGTANGHPLTPKQRRFMGWKAGQKAPDGTTVPGEQYTPRNRTDAYLVDDINNVLTTRTRTKNTGYAPEQQQLLTDAYIWSQKNQHISGRDSIQGYFNQAVDTNNPLQMQRARLSKIGGDPLSMYNSTPNLDVQQPQAPSYASMKGGGQIFKGGPVYLEHDPNYFANGGSMYAEGGSIQTHWGGEAEPIAYNPYDGGTTQFNGDSHAEGGIGMSYNGNKVEVEGGETAAKDSEGNLNVFGNMYVPGTKTKFKTASKEIAEKEEKFDKLKTNGTAVVNALDPKNKYDQIKFNAGQIMMEGGDLGQKTLAKKKQQLADLQNAMLDTAQMHNIDPQGMSQGNIKKAKKGMFMKKYPDGGKVIREGDEPVKDWDYYQKLINANTNAVKQGSGGGGLNDATYNDLLQATNEARSSQAALRGPGPRADLNINEPTRSDRNNNPGNIKYGSFAKSIDPNVKKDKDGFAIFSDPTIGHSAMYSLFTGKGYNNMTVKDAITKWTGGKPYDLQGLGDLNGRKVSDLKPEELGNVMDYMQKGEGTAYGIARSSLPPLAGAGPAIPNTSKFGLPTAPGFTTPATTPVTQPSVPIRSLPNQPDRQPIPTQAKPLGFGDVASDIFAIAQNQERPVYAQRYNPQLYQPYQVSFQDRLNDNNQSFNNVERLVGSTNPTALGALAGQKYGADNAIRAEEFRTNQGISNQVYNENIGLTNDAQYKNLQIADTQFTRQDLAQSKTREMNQLIANDISNKYSQVQMRNNTLRAYENLYNFRLNPNEEGGLTETNYNDPQNFDFSGQNGRGEGAGPSQRKIINYDRNGNVRNYRTVQNSELTDENQEQLLEERRRKNDDNMLKLFHGGNVRKRYKPI